jgi:hypothetical protein
MNLVSQAEFARMCGFSPKTISQWKKAGRLVLQGNRVDVEASRALLDKYRKGGAPVVTPAVTLPVTLAVTQPGKGNDRGGKAGKKRAGKMPAPIDPGEIEIQPGESLDAAAERLVTEIDVDMSLDEARRLKEVYLVLLHQLDFQQKSGALIDLETARMILFEEFRAQRDSWLNWPARVGPLVASELGIEADKVTDVLTKYIHQQVAQLGEPQAEFPTTSKYS